MSFVKLALLLSHFVAVLHTQNELHFGNNGGDHQTFGGIHFFKVHSSSGGMGIGIKLLFVLLIVGAILYWFIRQKCRKVLNPIQTVSQSQLPAHVPAPNVRPGQPLQLPYYSPVQPPQIYYTEPPRCSHRRSASVSSSKEQPCTSARI